MLVPKIIPRMIFSFVFFSFFPFFLPAANCIPVYRNLAGGCSSQKPAYYKTDQNLAHPRDFSYQQEN